MVKNIRNFALCIMALCASVSCAKELNAPENGLGAEASLIDITVKATGESTKTELGNNGTVYWVKGDCLSIFDGTAHQKFTTNLTGKSTCADFTGSITSGATKLYGLYPYNASARLNSGKITSTIPEVQYGVKGGFANGLNPSIAVASVSNNTIPEMAFKNIASLVAFDITQGGVYTSVTLRSLSEGDYISGAFVASLNSAGEVVVGYDNYSRTTITMLPSEGETFEAGTYYFVCVPCEGADLEIEFSNGEKFKVIPTSSSKTLRSNVITNFGNLDNGLELDEASFQYILKEDFGTETNTNLVCFDNNFNATGISAACVNYHSGWRVVRNNNRFQTTEENEAGINNTALYFGNTNNNNVGASGNPTTVAGYGEMANHADRLSLYVNNVYVGPNADKARIFFRYSVAQTLYNMTTDDGQTALRKLITVEFTKDGGKTWNDITPEWGNNITVSSTHHNFVSTTADLSGKIDDFITFRIKANYKQHLYVDDIQVAANYVESATTNNAPSIVRIFRQTPTTAYLECRAPSTVDMTEANMNSVVPYIGSSANALTAATDYTIRNVDVDHQMFEIIVRNIPQNGEDMYAALSYSSNQSGAHYFKQSEENLLYFANFDRFESGHNAIAALSSGWNISGYVSIYSVDSDSKSSYSANFNRERNLRDPATRQEKWMGYTANGSGYFVSGGFRGTNNMEASFRSINNIFSHISTSNVSGNGPATAGNFFRYGCEMDGWRGSLIYECEHSLYIGTGSSKNWNNSSNSSFIMTPRMGDKIPSGTASVTISFDAVPQSPTICNQIELVRVQTDGTTANGAETTSLKVYTLQTTDMGKYTNCTYTVEDADANTAFLIGGPSTTTLNTRYYIDNIKVTRN